MNTDLEHRAEELFKQSLDLPTEQRLRFLDSHCDDARVLELVRSLLAHHERGGNQFLAGAAAPPTTARPDPTLPQRIGAYALLRVIGQGGMGVVYEAEGDRPRRRVALKVIRPGLATPAMLRRFEYEADVLARLEHPGIARIYHAGVADAGAGPQPYFAMELVHGTRLDEWVKATSPPHKRRLQMLVDVCQAVHHAHTKGVIHRDLKPANILITPDGQPKVLDFGVARAIDADVQATTLHTEPGELVGTLPYMAPEQAAGRAHDLDTSSDVYALGVIAYELLAGRLPYAVHDKQLHEAVRIICEDEPSRLSSIDRSLRGDVETIVQKALEKERSRRYATAGELAADVKRYLDYEPITARRPSAWYQLAKFARRNKGVVAGVVGSIVLLVAGLTGTTIGLIGQARARAEAESEAAIARAVTEFQQKMLSAADPSRMLGDKVTVLQATHEAIKSLRSGAFADQPLIAAAVSTTIGRTLGELSRYDEAEPLLREALEVYRTTLASDDPRVAAAISQLAGQLLAQGRCAEAEPLFREARDKALNSKSASEADRAASTDNLGVTLMYQGNLREAEPLLQDALDKRRRILPANHEDLAMSLNNVGTLRQWQGRLAEAEPLLREGLRMNRAMFPHGHPDLVMSMSNLATLLHAKGALAEAESICREALEMRRGALPVGHPLVASSLNNLASLLFDQGRSTEAEPLYREALSIRLSTLPDQSLDVGNSLANLAEVLLAQGNLDEAQALCEQGLKIRRANLPANHPEIVSSLNAYGELLYARGKIDEADVLFREALDLCRNAPFISDVKLARALNDVAVVLQVRNDFAAAEPLLAELYRLAQERRLNVSSAAKSTAKYGSCLAKLGRHDQAEPLLRDAIERLKATDQTKGKPFLAAVAALAHVCEQTARPDEAAKWRAELAALEAATRSASQPVTQSATPPPASAPR